MEQLKQLNDILIKKTNEKAIYNPDPSDLHDRGIIKQSAAKTNQVMARTAFY